MGFAKSDVAIGHRLARSSPSALRGTPLAGQAVALATRYRRQVPTRLAYDMRLTDQPDLFD